MALTAVSVLVGAALAVSLAQRRFIERDADRWSARYAAEAAVFETIARLEREGLRFGAWPQALPDGRTAAVRARPWGGFVEILARIRVRTATVTLRALAGQRPPPALRASLVLGDTTHRLHVAGATRLDGPLWIGSRSPRPSTLDGQSFTGRVSGTPQSPGGFPRYDDALLRAAVACAEAALGEPLDASLPCPAHNLSGPPARFTDGDVQLLPADSTVFRDASLIVATGHLAIEGPIHLSAGTRLTAGRTLQLTGAVRGRDLLLYGRDSVIVEDGARVQAQALSRGGIRVRGNARLAYPSLLAVVGNPAPLPADAAPAAIVIAGRSRVEGAVAAGPGSGRPGVVIRPGARVDGIVFASTSAEVRGRVDGSVAAHRLRLAVSPSTYVNWLKDACIDVTARPAGYTLPLLWPGERTLRVAVLEDLSDRDAPWP